MIWWVLIQQSEIIAAGADGVFTQLIFPFKLYISFRASERESEAVFQCLPIQILTIISMHDGKKNGARKIVLGNQIFRKITLRCALNETRPQSIAIFIPTLTVCLKPVCLCAHRIPETFQHVLYKYKYLKVTFSTLGCFSLFVRMWSLVTYTMASLSLGLMFNKWAISLLLVHTHTLWLSAVLIGSHCAGGWNMTLMCLSVNCAVCVIKCHSHSIRHSWLQRPRLV